MLAAALGGALVAVTPAVPATAQLAAISTAEGVHAGELAVPINKSQVLRSDRPYAKALIGNPDVADVLPLTNQSLYVLGKKVGTTSLTLYDGRNSLIAVVDVAVGPDVTSLKRQLSELMPGDRVGARMSNDSIVLEGVVSSAPAADRAMQVAETYAPGKVINLLQIGSAQQVMLEVRFSEVKRSALKQIGAGFFVRSDGGALNGAIGGGASLTPGADGTGVIKLGSIADSFGIFTRTFRAFGANFEGILDALERKGAITTLAEPTLVALSGETASFLAGGEFPIPVAQGNGGTGTGTGNSAAISVEFKPFGVGLAFTPTVLADGVINLVVAPEVSSIDPSASITINGLTIPGLQTRRAKTTVELRDGESFAMAGLLRKDFQSTIRQFPLLGSIPIIGTLFRSTGFQRNDTELVIIVTPRLVRPVPAMAMKVPTDRASPPNEADLFLLGRTDNGVRTVPDLPSGRGGSLGEPAPPAPPARIPVPAAGGTAQKTAPAGLEKDYGHVL
ncbi:type II and III secretion system protein family protein [Sphingomonas ginkgonis]|uniref:Type II and III secretion system protein family protein n=1 Tax=Sphingomonas ginkgonis TaxID=2315330 RepID=A0A3R9Y7Z2_9SPHN|nr:type II and III secretion system protein family protein [Sphingomonas ginkgonis]